MRLFVITTTSSCLDRSRLCPQVFLLLVLLVVSATIIYFVEQALVEGSWFDSIPLTIYYMHVRAPLHRAGGAHGAGTRPGTRLVVREAKRVLPDRVALAAARTYALHLLSTTLL